jgi:hypothetical protein
MQYEHTDDQAQFVAGIFMLTEGHFSTAVVPAGIFGEDEQPTAMTYNYKSLTERNSHIHRVQTDWWAVWGGSLNSNILTTYLLSVQEAAMEEREI